MAAENVSAATGSLCLQHHGFRRGRWNFPFCDAIEIHREPQAGVYAGLRTARRGMTVTPLAFPSIASLVDQILG